MKTLNIFLHGLFTIVEEPYRLVLAVPLVDEHDHYMIACEGDPLQDPQAIPRAFRYGRGAYELKGVKAEPRITSPGPVLPPDRTARIGTGDYIDVLCGGSGAYASFTLPRTKHVYTCRNYTRGVHLNFEGYNADEITSQSFASIIVLAYEFEHLRDIHFSGLPGFHARYRPSTNPLDVDKYVNMVIVSAGHHSGSGGVATAFDQMMKKVLPTKDIRLKPVDNPSTGPSNDCTSAIPGFDQATIAAFTFEFSHFDPADCVPLVVDNS